eukprot:TRINITY_DN15682_c0_g1_i1.p1 TRINITY_DN15682_c0_g1~~TRINITY_DN15682_c0_g1_i1.p1  ORF type:complete len:69 (-),score=1.62 TRINITY_DN15682_c0_g1_i1:145-351(-)
MSWCGIVILFSVSEVSTSHFCDVTPLSHLVRHCCVINYDVFVHFCEFGTSVLNRNYGLKPAANPGEAL